MATTAASIIMGEKDESAEYPKREEGEGLQWQQHLCRALLLQAVEHASDDTVSEILDQGGR